MHYLQFLYTHRNPQQSGEQCHQKLPFLLSPSEDWMHVHLGPHRGWGWGGVTSAGQMEPVAHF